MSLITIITAVYNNEKYVKAAVDSVLNQKFQDFEYIIIDDGSTDNTPQVLDDIALLDKRIRVIHQKNQWIYASFNNGVNLASGKYIYILNSDDTLEKESLNKFATVIQKYKPDVIYTPVLIHKCDKQQNIVVFDRLNYRNLVKKDQYLKNKEEFRDNWINLNKLKLITNQANLYRKELMLLHPFRNDVYGADSLFNISIAEDICSAYIMKDPVYNFFEYGFGEMNASVGKYYEYEHDMFNEYYDLNKRLLMKWNRYDNEASLYCIKKRLADYSHELRSLNSSRCSLSIDDKVKKILNEYIEEWMYNEVIKFNLEEELESRTLSGIRELFCSEIPQKDSDMYFMYELLDGLLKYEKTDEDYKKIMNAIYNNNNQRNIGKVFYNKIKNGERFL